MHVCVAVGTGVNGVLLTESCCFVPGSPGHETLLKAAVQVVQKVGLPVGPAAFELSIANADKPPLASEVGAARCGFHSRWVFGAVPP